MKIDHLIWAVQRKLLQGEGRYFDALAVSMLLY